MITLAEARQLEWANVVQTGTQAIVEFIPAKVRHTPVIYVLSVGSNDIHNGIVLSGVTLEFTDAAAVDSYGWLALGAGNPSTIYTKIKGASGKELRINFAGTANYETFVTAGYTYEPDPTPRHM
jgi:hypothetical protein